MDMLVGLKQDIECASELSMIGCHSIVPTSQTLIRRCQDEDGRQFAAAEQDVKSPGSASLFASGIGLAMAFFVWRFSWVSALYVDRGGGGCWRQVVRGLRQPTAPTTREGDVLQNPLLISALHRDGDREFHRSSGISGSHVRPQ
jgi:hypothetical protein